MNFDVTIDVAMLLDVFGTIICSSLAITLLVYGMGKKEFVAPALFAVALAVTILGLWT